MRRRLICYDWINPIMGYTESNLTVGSFINILGNCYRVLMRASYNDDMMYQDEEYQLQYKGSSDNYDNLTDIIMEISDEKSFIILKER